VIINLQHNPSTTPSTESNEQKNAGGTLVTGEALEASINNIVAMGFSRELVVAAMKAAFNTPARAVELLTSGFQLPQASTQPPPANSQPPAAQPTTTTTTQPQQQPQATSNTTQTRPPPASTSTGSGVFDGLKQHPQFPTLCMLAQQGGHDALRQILEYFSQVSPQLLNLIVQNQEEFIRLLQTPIGPADVSPASPPSGPSTPGVVRLTVTPEDERAIHNIVSMGFDRNRVLEAYFLFEKDEAQTINFLLNNPESDN